MEMEMWTPGSSALLVGGGWGARLEAVAGQMEVTERLAGIRLSALKTWRASPRGLTTIFGRLAASHAAGAVDVVWLSLGDEPVTDWLAFRRLWKGFVHAVRCKLPAVRGVGLSGLALLTPGDQPGHLSPEFVAKLDETGDFQKWIGIPIRLGHAAWYSMVQHIVRGERHNPISAFRRLGFLVQGEVDEGSSRHLDRLTPGDLPGDTVAARISHFVDLLPPMDRLWASSAGLLIPTRGGTSMTDHRKAENPVSHDETISRSPFLAGRSLSVQPESAALWREAVSSGLLTELERVELLGVACGLRPAMRTQVLPSHEPGLRRLLAELGLTADWRLRTVVSPLDRGKGGFRSVYTPSSDEGGARTEQQLFLYVATNADTAREAWESEEQGDDDALGEILGYPSCCRTAFRRNFRVALETAQGDVAPLVGDQTVRAPPWPFALNIGAWYFGAGLVNFFPCSYWCRAAAEFGQILFASMRGLLPNEAEALKGLLCSAVLYTEFRGVYLFPGAIERGGLVRYDSTRLMATTQNSLTRLLASGDSLHRGEGDHIDVLRGDHLQGRVGGKRVRLLLFGDSQ